MIFLTVVFFKNLGFLRSVIPPKTGLQVNFCEPVFCQENHTFLGQKENTLWRFYAAHIPAGTEY